MTKTRNKLKIMGLVLTLVMMLSMLPVLSLTAFATDGSSNPWESTGDNDWYYYDENACAEDNCRGIYVSGECNVCGSSERTTQTINAWEKQNDNWYYYNPEGELATGWQQIEGEWYYFDTETGALDEEITSSGNNEWYYANDQLTSCDNDTCTGTYENGICSVCDAYQPATLNADGYYEIANAGQLYWFAQQVNGGKTAINGKLTANIVVNQDVLTADGDLNGDGLNFREWTPIGKGSRPYTGTFDGAEHTVSGLYIYSSQHYNYAGLFSCIRGATVKNVGVLDSYFHAQLYVGGVVGNSFESTIASCYNTGTVIGEDNVGGVLGISYISTISNCYNTGDVKGEDSVGGVAGYSESDSTITSCYNTGHVKGVENVGGVVGWNYNSTITNCYNTGAVNGEYNVGGVASYNWNGGTITNCYNTGAVTSKTYVGGVASNNFGSTITNCYYLEGTATGDIISEDADDKSVAKTADQFKSGEVAYLLSQGENGSIWGQDLDNGKPVQTNPTFTGAKVYCGYISCGEDAEKVYTNDDTISAEKPDHDMSEATCTTPSICKREDCGYTVGTVNENAHAWNNGVVTTNPTCTAVGTKTFTCMHNSAHTKTEDVAIDESAHIPNADDGDCTTDITCSICGDVTTEGADSHTGGTATCEHKAECAVCGKEYGNPADHSFVEGKCECGETDPNYTPGTDESGTDAPGSDEPEEPKNGLSGGAIAGIVTGSVVVLGGGGFAIYWFVIKKKTWADLIAVFKKN